MFAALFAFFLTTVTMGDGPGRPNDVVKSNFFLTTIERGPVETHSCNTYKAVSHAPLREKQYSSELSAPGRDKNQMYIHVECK